MPPCLLLLLPELAPPLVHHNKYPQPTIHNPQSTSKMSALERRRTLRKRNQEAQSIRNKELKQLRQEGFRSLEHKQRFDDRVARNPELTAPRISWNDTKYVASHKSAEQIHKERSRNSEILELDYLHELNEAWLADKERLYVERRESIVFRHQEMVGLMTEDFRSRFHTLEIECVSKQELRIETKMLTEQQEEVFEDAEETHLSTLRDFDSDFEVELRRFTQVIRRRTDDWIAHCRLYDMYVQGCRAAGIPVCTRFSMELGHQHITLKSYGLGQAGAAVVAAVVAQNCFLHSLDLSGNDIGDAGAASLALAIRGGKGNGMLRGDERDKDGKVQMLCALRDLRVAKNKISSSGASDLLAACCIGKDRPRTPANPKGSSGVGGASGPGNSRMAAKTVVEILDLSSNVIGDDVCAALQTVLSSHLCGLRKLDLSYNRLGIKSARAVGAGLSVNRTLRQLSMRWNSLGAGADDIATACVSNDCLETLDLGFCACGDVCGTFLRCLLLLSSGFVLTISISVSSFFFFSYFFLKNGFRPDPCLVSAPSLVFSSLVFSSLFLFLSALRFAKAIEKEEDDDEKIAAAAINVPEGEEDGESERSIAAGVPSSLSSLMRGRRRLDTMEQLLLDHNSITASGALPLLTALRTNTTLRVLDIAGNDNNVPDGCRDVLEVLRSGGDMPEYGEDGEMVPQPSEEEREAMQVAERERKVALALVEEKERKNSEGGDDAPPQKIKKIKPPPLIVPCRVGVDIPGSLDNDYLIDEKTQEELAVTRFLLCPGGVDRKHFRHETHETAMTFVIPAKSLSLLQKYIGEARKKQQSERRKAKLQRERSEQKKKEQRREQQRKGGSSKSMDALDDDEETLDHWLGEEHSSREVPAHAFKPGLHVEVVVSFTRGVSRNAMDAAKSFGHTTPMNTVCLKFPISVLPPSVFRRAEMRMKQESRRRKCGGEQNAQNGSTPQQQQQRPLVFRSVISRVSTLKGDGMRFSVTNASETDFILPAALENVPFVEEDSEDEDDGVTWGKKTKEKIPTPRVVKRANWAAEAEAENQGASKEEDEDEDEDEKEDDDDEEEEEEDEEEEDQEGGEEEEEVLQERTVDLPSILMTWEPLEKFGRTVVQFHLPTFFVAGLELDVGSTIMISYDNDFVGDDEILERGEMKRRASMGTIRMAKNSSSAMVRTGV